MFRLAVAATAAHVGYQVAKHHHSHSSSAALAVAACDWVADQSRRLVTPCPFRNVIKPTAIVVTQPPPGATAPYVPPPLE